MWLVAISEPWQSRRRSGRRPASFSNLPGLGGPSSEAVLSIAPELELEEERRRCVWDAMEYLPTYQQPQPSKSFIRDTAFQLQHLAAPPTSAWMQASPDLETGEGLKRTSPATANHMHVQPVERRPPPSPRSCLGARACRQKKNGQELRFFCMGQSRRS